MSDDDEEFTMTPAEYLQGVIDHRNLFTPQERPLIQAVVDADAKFRAEINQLRAALSSWVESLDDPNECWNVPFGLCETLGYPPSPAEWCVPCLTRALLAKGQR